MYSYQRLDYSYGPESAAEIDTEGSSIGNTELVCLHDTEYWTGTKTTCVTGITTS